MNGIAYLNKGAGRVLTADETRERSRAAFNLWRQADYIAPECHAAIYLRARVSDGLPPSGSEMSSAGCRMPCTRPG
jgi:hypothetical protein